MILYFSGTGNSRYIAGRLAEALNDVETDLNAKIKENDSSPVRTGENVILVAPTYAWRIPKVVSEWLLKTELVSSGRIWFVLDCGSEIGNAAKYNRRLAKQKELQYMGTAQIIMPENYIAMFNAPQADEAVQIVRRSNPDISAVIEAIKSGKEFLKPRCNFYDRVMSDIVNPLFYRFKVKADLFCADGTCVGCGQCAKRCPLNNIQIKSGKPVWGKDLCPFFPSGYVKYKSDYESEHGGADPTESQTGKRKEASDRRKE